MKLFDPEGKLFTTGVHCPQIVFVGDKSRRTVAAIERRAEKRKGKGKAGDGGEDGKGNIGEKGKSKGKEKGKAHMGGSKWVWK